MSTVQGGRSPSPEDADDRVYRAVAAGESADTVLRAIDRACADASASGSAAQQRAAAVNQAGPTGETPLQAADRQGRGDLVGVLLENGADAADAVEGRRFTPLVVAAMYGLVDTVRALLKAGHDPDGKVWLAAPGFESARHCTAAHWCVRMPLPTPTDDSDTDGDEENDDDDRGARPRHTQRLDVLEILVREGRADINARDSDGRTPLFWFLDEGVRDPGNAALDLLVSLGADVNARDDDGGTPLFTCAFRGDLAQVQRLIEHGSSPDAVAEDGLTPLMAACASAADPSRRDVVLELLRRSSVEARRSVMDFPDRPKHSAIDVILSVVQTQLEPWHRQVVGEPVSPENAARALPSATERAKQTEDELAARRTESRRWCAHGDVFDFAQEAKELGEAQQGVEARRALVAALEAELEAAAAGETAISSSSSSSSSDDEGVDQ